MSSDVDFEQFIKLLDGALASDDKNIQQALRKFLFVAAMVLGDECEPGPFTKMMETMDEMQRRLHSLENKDVQITDTNPYVWPNSGGGTPYWGGGSSSGSGTITFTNTGTSTNAVSTTTTGSNTTTTGNITLGGTTGYCYPTVPGTGVTGTTTWITPGAEETGTEIKQEIEDALDRLANVA